MRAGLSGSSAITHRAAGRHRERARSARSVRRDTRIDLAVAQDLAQREGIKAIVDGEVTGVGRWLHRVGAARARRLGERARVVPRDGRWTEGIDRGGRPARARDPRQGGRVAAAGERDAAAHPGDDRVARGAQEVQRSARAPTRSATTVRSDWRARRWRSTRRSRRDGARSRPISRTTADRSRRSIRR